MDTTKNTPSLKVVDGKSAAEAVNEANAKVAQKFGLNVADLTSADVHTTNKDAANAYGRALAVVSQMENSGVNLKEKFDNGGLGDSIQQAVSQLKNAATNSTNPYTQANPALSKGHLVINIDFSGQQGPNPNPNPNLRV